MKWSLFVLLGSLVAAPLAGQGSFRAGMALDPQWTVTGKCHPSNVRFTGRINGTGRGDAVYQWVPGKLFRLR